jgi:hypothetical protein
MAATDEALRDWRSSVCIGLAPAAGNDSWNQGVERIKTSKDWPGMVAYTTRWTQAKPQEATAWCLLGFAYGKLRQWQPMKPAYDKMSRHQPA